MRRDNLFIIKEEFSSFNTASGMRSHVTWISSTIRTNHNRFNTASGMRSHVTNGEGLVQLIISSFQYRKRYEVTCDRC